MLRVPRREQGSNPRWGSRGSAAAVPRSLIHHAGVTVSGRPDGLRRPSLHLLNGLDVWVDGVSKLAGTHVGPVLRLADAKLVTPALCARPGARPTPP